MVELGDIVEVLDSKRRPITKSDRKEGVYPYYGATGILDYIDGYIFEERLILLGEDGAKWDSGEKTAFIAEGKYWVNNHAHVLKPKKEIVLDKFLVSYLNSLDLNPYITGVTVPKLNQEKMRSIKIVIPPMKDQEGLVIEIETQEKIIESNKKLIEIMEKKIEEVLETI